MRVSGQALVLAALLALGPPAIVQAGEATTAQPRIVSEEQYRCLIKHRDELAVSKRGTVIDLASCPPKPVLGAFPQRASERYLLLTPQDLACLKKIRPGETKIVKRREGAKVAMYLRPCGAG